MLPFKDMFANIDGTLHSFIDLYIIQSKILRVMKARASLKAGHFDHTGGGHGVQGVHAIQLIIQFSETTIACHVV